MSQPHRLHHHPGALSLLMRRVAARGPLSSPPPAGSIDYYGNIAHFAGAGAGAGGRGYVVAPSHPLAPQTRSAGPDRWGWLGAFGQPGGAEPPRFALFRNGFDSGLSEGNYFVACALELLSGLQHAPDHPTAAGRLAQVAAPQKARSSPVASAFVDSAWRGLFLMMDHCLSTLRVPWEEVAANNFPELRTVDAQGAPTPMLTSWPDGYRQWLDRLATVPGDASLPLRLSGRLDRTWGLVARLRRFVRAGREVSDWVDGLCAWTPGTEVEPDGRWVALTARDQDGMFGRRSVSAGRFGPQGMRHAAPLALLIAAMAADRHISRHGQLLMELSTRMTAPDAPAMPQPWPDYDSAWIESARRLARALRAGPTPDLPAPSGGTRFAPGTWGAATFEAWPVTLAKPIWSLDDEGPLVEVGVPLQALGRDVDAHLARWESSAVPCFLEAHRSLSDRSEPFELVVTDETWVDAGMLWLRLRPQTAPTALLASLWRGDIEADLATPRAWLTDGAASGQPPFPVLMLRFDLMMP